MPNLPLHPVIVHLPMALAVLVPLVAALALLSWWRGWLPRRAWLLVIGLQAALAVGALLAMNTGERDEDRVERIVGESALEAHEGAAKLFTIGAFGVLVLMLGPMLGRREKVQKGLALAASAATLGVAGLGLNVGHKGGELVYRHGAASAYSHPATAARASSGSHDDD